MKKIPIYGKSAYIVMYSFAFSMTVLTLTMIFIFKIEFHLLVHGFMLIIALFCATAPFSYKKKYILLDKENDEIVFCFPDSRYFNMKRTLSNISNIVIQDKGVGRGASFYVLFTLKYYDDKVENIEIYTGYNFVLSMQMARITSELEKYFIERDVTFSKYSNDPKERLRQLKAESREIMKGKKK